MKALGTLAFCWILAAPACGQELQAHAPSWSDGKRNGRLVMRIKCGDCTKYSVSTPPPIYPRRAKAQKLQGPVKLRAVIGQDGSVRELDTLSGNPILAQAAIDAVQDWKYRPTLLNGEPVETVATVEVEFKIEGDKAKASNGPSEPNNPR